MSWADDREDCPGTIHFAARVRRSYARIAGLLKCTDDELDSHLRVACEQLGSGQLVRRTDGCVEIIVAGSSWLLRPDCLSGIGVKKVPGSSLQSITAQRRESEVHSAI